MGGVGRRLARMDGTDQSRSLLSQSQVSRSLAIPSLVGPSRVGPSRAKPSRVSRTLAVPATERAGWKATASG
jgi:hypothetical protein